MYCEWCGKKLETDANDSIHVCGSKDRPPAFCMNCGAPLTPGARLCSQCNMPAGVAPFRAVPPGVATSPDIPPPIAPAPLVRADGSGELLPTAGPMPGPMSASAGVGFTATSASGASAATTPAPRTNTLAIVAVVMAFSPIVLNVVFISTLLRLGAGQYFWAPYIVVGALAAFLGAIAKGQIQMSNGTQGGMRFATSAIGLGGAMVAFGIFIPIAFLSLS